MKAEDLEKLEAGEENIEDGEISDSSEEEVDKPLKSASLDPRARLRRNSSASKKKDGGSDKENTKDAQQSEKSGRSYKRISQDEKEIQKDAPFKKRGAKGFERKTTDDPKTKGLNEVEKKEEVKRNEEIEEVMRPELLLGFSTEDIDHKLIPFKKRQFKQLQFEEIQLKVPLSSSSTICPAILTRYCASGPDCC